MSWSDLSNHCVPAEEAPLPQAALHLDSAAPDDMREEAVLAVFTEGGYDGVRVVVDDDDIGILTRDAVHDYLGSAHPGLDAEDFTCMAEGLGAGDNASLPGYPTIRGGISLGQRWHCPVDGCPEPDTFIIGFDPTTPLKCAVHTDQDLQRIK